MSDSKESVRIHYEPCHPMREGGRITVVQAPLCRSIGAKRNRGCEEARGEYILNFDDDDFYGPNRITDQVARLIETGKAITGYRDLIFTDGERRWLNTNWPGGYGATLAYRRDWWLKHPYPDTSDGEDWEFVSAAMRANEFVVAPAREHIVISIHAGNTSPRVLGAGWQLLQ